MPVRRSMYFRIQQNYLSTYRLTCDIWCEQTEVEKTEVLWCRAMPFGKQLPAVQQYQQIIIWASIGNKFDSISQGQWFRPLASLVLRLL